MVRSTRTGLERTVAISKEAQRALMEAHLNGEHAGYIPSYHKSMYETHPDVSRSNPQPSDGNMLGS